MPSPFPGMDPYLENTDLWRGVHTSLIHCIGAALNRDLPDGFAASLDERCYIVPPQRDIYPDVAVRRDRFTPRPASAPAGGTAVQEPPLQSPVGAPTGTVTVLPDERTEAFIEILALGEQERIVTVIEILSPANKNSGSPGYQSYVRKQEQVIESNTNLLEIDLLRQGSHVLAVPRQELAPYGSYDYLVCLHRAEERYRYEFWLNRVREPLPVVRVPLTGGVPYVLLDLQEAFHQAYEAGPYARRVDYTANPVPPLNREDTLWADALLREKGKRS
jgi:hypothetical protein